MAIGLQVLLTILLYSTATLRHPPGVLVYSEKLFGEEVIGNTSGTLGKFCLFLSEVRLTAGFVCGVCDLRALGGGRAVSMMLLKAPSAKVTWESDRPQKGKKTLV